MKQRSSVKSLYLETCKDTKNTLKILRELALIDFQSRHPHVPEYARITLDYNDRTANGLTKCIIDYIRFNNGQAERINCTGKLIDNRKTFTDTMGYLRTIGSLKYGHTSGQRGTADISATIKGRSVKIEIKIGSDRQSEAQKEYQRSIEASGGIYFIAKDFSQFFAWYQLTFGGQRNGH